MAEAYIDLAIKRQVLLERLKTAESKGFSKTLKTIERLVKETIYELDFEVNELSAIQLEKLLNQLRKDVGEIFTEAVNAFSVNLGDIAAVSFALEIQDIKRTVNLKGTKLEKFTKPVLFRRIIKRPLTTRGQLLDPWLKDFKTTETNRVADVIRAGWATGKDNTELVQSVIGTKVFQYKNGTMDQVYRNASTIVRTAVQHVASSARQELWENNKDIFRGYSWLSTLDRKTSEQCKGLDGQFFEFGKGPVPPIHPRCRSTTIPELGKEYDFLKEGSTRSAEFGPVDAENSYYDWLKRQPEEVVEQALGKTRAKLFLDGGLSASEFRQLSMDRNFEPLTLAEMRELEPAAFKAAGL